MVPNGWNTKPLADIVKEKISYGIVQAGPHVPDGIPYIKSSDVRGTINPDALQRTSQEIHFKYRRSSVHPGDIVFSLRGNIGESAIVPASLPEANLTQGTARISVSVEHSNLFHYYQLASEKILNRVNALSKGSTFKEISLEELRKVKVLCAPLPEQKKIAQILSAWDKAITTTEQLLANSQQQKKALMQQLLTGKKRLLDENGVRFSGDWNALNLGEILSKVSNGVTYDAKNVEGLPVTRIETISTGKVNFNKVGFAPDEENTRRFKLHQGDILYSHINSLEHIGRVAYFNDARPLYHGMNLLLLRTGEKHDSLYIYYLLGSELGKKYAKSYAKSAVNQASISTTDVKAFRFLIPNLPEQQKIAAVLSAADQEISALQQKLDALKQEKKALMQQLLTGKRRVKIEEVGNA
ncbi:restriction endonuclease subunit S [Shewanella algae]|uniref:restriction endonuclease subunit S n=1 Tax=Shewanella algae TaxID=38313 RepID=UPI001AAFCEAB|nr:restriction endonuclease subunit S [Shewanella algae]MBO2662637.1 restriction endonuclease subunit S [Shewanella algae]MCL1052567.1 restriction endonuclease subunit S [Shewanella algae]